MRTAVDAPQQQRQHGLRKQEKASPIRLIASLVLLERELKKRLPDEAAADIVDCSGEFAVLEGFRLPDGFEGRADGGGRGYVGRDSEGDAA